MRNMRSALWALGLAGAAYAWKNRGKLQQQMGSLRQQTPYGQLPDQQAPSNRTQQQSEMPRSRVVGERYNGTEL